MAVLTGTIEFATPPRLEFTGYSNYVGGSLGSATIWIRDMSGDPCIAGDSYGNTGVVWPR